MMSFEKRLAGVIDADGSIVRGYLVEDCEFDGTNEYTVTWGVPLQGGDAKTNFVGTVGSATDEEIAPGLITVGLGKESNQLRVHTFDVNGNPAARSFHIACFRDQ
jgi:hypothetical protein